MNIMFYHPQGFCDGTMWLLYSSKTGKVHARVQGEPNLRDMAHLGWTLPECLGAVASGDWKMHVYD